MRVTEGMYSDLTIKFTKLQDSYREIEEQNKKLRECVDSIAIGKCPVGLAASLVMKCLKEIDGRDNKQIRKILDKK